MCTIIGKGKSCFNSLCFESNALQENPILVAHFTMPFPEVPFVSVPARVLILEIEILFP